MTTRIFVAGIIGGIVMFIWNFIAHDILPLGHTGMRQVPNESAVVDALRTNMEDNHGMFVFPWVDPKGSSEDRKAAMDKIATSPSGLLVYHPQRPINFARMIGIELITEILEAILVVFLLSSTRLLTAGSRILFVTIAGVIAAMVTNVPYWNFWGFPKSYTLALMCIQIVGFFIVGVVSAFILRNRDPVAESR